MAQIIYPERALENLERAFEFPLKENPSATVAAAEAIASAVDNLAAHPLVGRRIQADLRELVISFGDTGYIAVYRFVVQKDEVRILALRHQRQVGYLP